MWRIVEKLEIFATAAQCITPLKHSKNVFAISRLPLQVTNLISLIRPSDKHVEKLLLFFKYANLFYHLRRPMYALIRSAGARRLYCLPCGRRVSILNCHALFIDGFRQSKEQTVLLD